MRRIQVIKNRACGAHHVIIILVKNRSYTSNYSTSTLLHSYCTCIVTRASLYRQISISHTRHAQDHPYTVKIPFQICTPDAQDHPYTVKIPFQILTPDVQDHPYTVKIPFHMNARRTRSSLYRQNSFSHTHA